MYECVSALRKRDLSCKHLHCKLQTVTKYPSAAPQSIHRLHWDSSVLCGTHQKKQKMIRKFPIGTKHPSCCCSWLTIAITPNHDLSKWRLGHLRVEMPCWFPCFQLIGIWLHCIICNCFDKRSLWQVFVHNLQHCIINRISIFQRNCLCPPPPLHSNNACLPNLIWNIFWQFTPWDNYNMWWIFWYAATPEFVLRWWPLFINSSFIWIQVSSNIICKKCGIMILLFCSLSILSLKLWCSANKKFSSTTVDRCLKSTSWTATILFASSFFWCHQGCCVLSLPNCDLAHPIFVCHWEHHPDKIWHSSNCLLGQQ